MLFYYLLYKSFKFTKNTQPFPCQTKFWKIDRQDFHIGETLQVALNMLNSLKSCADVSAFINKKYSHRAETKPW